MSLYRNLIWQSLGQGGSKALTLAFYIILPRIINIESYGQFSLSMAIGLMLIQPILDIGLDYVVIKQVSRGNEEVVKQAFVLRSLTSILVFLMLPVIASLFNLPLLLLIGIYSYFSLLSFQKICFSRQRGAEKMGLESIMLFSQKGLALLFLSTADRFFNISLYWVLGALLLSQFLSFFGVFTISWGWLAQVLKREHFDWKKSLIILKEGMALSGISLLGLLYFKIDILMLGMMGNNSIVGEYSLVYRLLEGLIFFPSLVMIVFFPRLSKFDEFHEFLVNFKRLLVLLLFLGAIISSSVVLAAPTIISLFYGAIFLPVAPLLKILALSMFPICIGHVFSYSLIALEKHKIYLAISILAVLLNIVLNIFMIPAYFAKGAAVSTFITEILITLMYVLVVKQEIQHIRSSANL